MDKFWRKVNKTAGCWLWTGSTDKDGYGKFGTGGKMWLAHRYAYIICGGTIAAGEEVDHLCHNPPCVNPAHLEAVSAEVNNWRAIVHKRNSRQSTNSSNFV